MAVGRGPAARRQWRPTVIPGRKSAARWATTSTAPATLNSNTSAAAPEGITVFFDLVGGEQFQATVQVAGKNARLALCGALAGHLDDSDRAHPRLELMTAIGKSRTLKAFAAHHIQAGADVEPALRNVAGGRQGHVSACSARRRPGRRRHHPGRARRRQAPRQRPGPTLNPSGPTSLANSPGLHAMDISRGPRQPSRTSAWPCSLSLGS